MHDFESKRSPTSERDEQARAASPGLGKRTLTETETEMLPASSPAQQKADAAVQRKADAAPATPTAPQPSIADLFGGGVQRKAYGGKHG